MVRSPCCDKMGLKKGPWTPEEDGILLAYIQQHGHGSWRSLPSKAGLQRCGKSCRLRWTNYLRPDIKRGHFSFQEEQTIIQLHALLGNRWSSIATHLPKRTDNEIKNYWNTHLKKKLTSMGIDPVTHKPKDSLALNICESKYVANISHLAQWESARLQAEARLVRQSKLLPVSHAATAPPPPPPPALPLAPLPCLDVLKVWEWTNPGKDISSMVLNGFSGPENMTSLYNENSYVTSVDCVDNSVENCNEAEGIMENSMDQLHSYGDDSSGFSSFVDEFVDLSATGTSRNAPGSCWGVLEENKNNSWNVLNVPTSPAGSPMF